MNLFNKKFILALASAATVFAAGCTHRAVRPTPDQTLIPGGSASVVAVDTVAVAPAPDTSAYVTTNYPSSSNVQWSTQTTDVYTPPPAPPILEERPKYQGDLFGNELRNVPELQSIYFGFDRSAIEKNERPKFQALKDFLAKNPQYRVIFEGHCDWRGTAEYNLALGDRRANSAKRYAVGIGIDPAKIDVRSKGSSQAAERAADAVMAKDRRAEIIVLVK